MLVPVQAYLTRGVGVHPEELVAFEIALRDAGIAAQNLVTVSSILPPQCPLIDRKDGEAFLRPGQILHVVMSREETNEPHRAVGASIGIARPRDPSRHGFIAEHGGYGLTESALGDHAKDLAVTMLASTMGVDVDPSLSHDERRRRLENSEGIERVDSVVSTAFGDERGWTTCVVAAAVFVMDWMISDRDASSRP